MGWPSPLAEVATVPMAGTAISVAPASTAPATRIVATYIPSFFIRRPEYRRPPGPLRHPVPLPDATGPRPARRGGPIAGRFGTRGRGSGAGPLRRPLLEERGHALAHLGPLDRLEEQPVVHDREPQVEVA